MVKTDNFILRYSNCWEDAGLLTSRAKQGNCGRILSICSGGDNSLSLLTADPGEIVVVDVNPLQLYLLELKMVAIKALTYEDCLAFLGFKPGRNRWETYKTIEIHLSEKASGYWKKKKKLLSAA